MQARLFTTYSSCTVFILNCCRDFLILDNNFNFKVKKVSEAQFL